MDNLIKSMTTADLQDYRNELVNDLALAEKMGDSDITRFHSGVIRDELALVDAEIKGRND